MILLKGLTKEISMKLLYLGNHQNLNFTRFLENFGLVDFSNKKLEAPECQKYEWIISYGYRHIIKTSILHKTKNPILNLHISFLPFNKGSHPNYWSFKEKTPNGVTIHFMDKGIDTGPILVQKECVFDLNETLKTSYQKLKREVEDLFFSNFKKIIDGSLKPTPQKDIGTYHSSKDLPDDINWNIKIKNL